MQDRKAAGAGQGGGQCRHGATSLGEAGLLFFFGFFQQFSLYLVVHPESRSKRAIREHT